MCVKFDFVLNVTIKEIRKMLKERGYSEKAIKAVLEWYSKNTEDISISNTMAEKDV